MYRVVMGDDDQEFLRQAAAQVRSALEGMDLAAGQDFEIAPYAAPEPLMKELLAAPGSCQFLLLDVDFAGRNGIELAKELRGAGAACSLVYLTAFRDYVFDCFGTRPLWYLIKPADWAKLAELVRADYRQQCQNTLLQLKVNGQALALPYQQIYALEAAAHRVRIWLQGAETLSWNGALASLGPSLPAWCFCKCHNSYYINLTHVAEFGRTEVKMDDGARFPVSRRFYAPALKQYFSVLKQ